MGRKRKPLVKEALEKYFWVSQINTQQGITGQHIVQLSKLWGMLDTVHINNTSR
jgi:hypothetical protein